MSIFSYSIDDFFMFSPDIYQGLFSSYLESYGWALPLSLFTSVYALGWLFGISKFRNTRLLITLIGLNWMWVGYVFHWSLFRSINLAASVFAIFFLITGFLFVFSGLWLYKRRPNVSPQHSVLKSFPGLLSLALLTASVFAYPFLPTAGLSLMAWTPDPLALGTLGLALQMKGALHWLLFFPSSLWLVIAIVSAHVLDLSDFYWLTGGLTLAGVAQLIQFFTHSSHQ